MLAHLLEKLPLVHSWIDATLNQHAANSYALKDFISKQKFYRLPSYFTDELLSRAKVILVDKVPVPPLSSFGLTEFKDFEEGNYAGITYKDTYFIKHQNISDEPLHFHELVHIIQWEYLGVDNFLLAYALGLIENGYTESPLEKMAYNHQQRFIDDRNSYSVEDAVKLELNILMQNIGH